jgi:manganese/zinc-transporting P-type ATPase C
MQFSIRHSMEGRVRLYAPAFCRNRSLAEKTLAWLRNQDTVESARINYACSSLVIKFDPKGGKIGDSSPTRHRFEDFRNLPAILSLSAKDATERGGRREPSSRAAAPLLASPLLLPSLSFALTFVPHPIVQLVNLPLMLRNAYPIASDAFGVLTRERRLNVDFLDTLAIGASLAQGHFIACSLMIWLIRLGNWIRDLTAAKSRRAGGDLLEFRNAHAWINRDGTVVSIASEELQVGDEVVVFPGELIPVDGEIIEGAALIDQKTITGEGLPVSRSVGEAAFAATVIREGRIVIRAQNVGDQTTAAQIVNLIDSAPVGDTRMQNHAERLADKLVTPTLALASGAAVLTSDFTRFTSLVIVDYGTGIRVAAPTTVLSSMARAAREGIIIKSGRYMERLAEADTVVFDKTGTLTRGAPEVVDVIPYQKNLGVRKMISLAAAAESRLQHPVADALRQKAGALGNPIAPCDEPNYLIGMGVEALVEDFVVHVGNARLMRQYGVDVECADADRRALEERGCSCLYLAVDGALAALIPYADQIRPESAAIIRRLHALGVKSTVMLTGDNAVVARAVGEKIGISSYVADMLPSEKAEVIQTLRKDGRIVAMVGDGINDSPALSFADVGVAMKHGAEVVHESAAVVLMEDSLEKLVEAIEISRGAVALIKQNYGIVIGMNTLALALALPGGMIGPSMTALISNGSGMLASMNAVRPLLGRR